MSPQSASLTDPSSPSADKKSIFSFYIHEPSNINPFNPSSASTLRKTHHVSMPTLPVRPKPMALKHRLSLDNLHMSTQKLQPSLQPFLITVQSTQTLVQSSAGDNTDTAFTRLTQGMRSTVRWGEKKKGGVSKLKVCVIFMKRNFSCGSVTEESIGRKQPGYYFI